MPRLVRTFLATAFVWFLRAQVDTFWTWFQWRVWFHHPRTIGHDEKRLASGIAKLERVPYGPHRLEQLHKLEPDEEHAAQLADAPCRHMLYAHGGGFVFASSAVLLQSVTSFVRRGFTVYSMDYPLAPEDRFPTALISVLDCLHWIRETEGVERVVVLGDSAGASLVSMAAAIIMNDKLRRDFAQATARPELESWSYPVIERLGCLYGLLDQTSWRGRQLKQITMIENFLAEGGIASCLELYASQSNVFENRLCLMDIVDEIERFPRTLFIGGSQDPLVYSTVVAHEKLLTKNLDVHCKIYPARHGFFGVPLEWTFGAWRTDAQPAFELLAHFFEQPIEAVEANSALGPDAVDAERGSQTSRPAYQHIQGHRRRCSWDRTGQTCCSEDRGDFGLYALKAYDRIVSDLHSEADDSDSDSTVSAEQVLRTTMLRRR
ncbi:uncharacterized protein MONBRDRAFT_24502 [Monosiga brevicollis MX1]|uniref:Alpha/beta hydrolase fold-3 domain-containing protein n=1 Tax=Monosiga brevicollis TaxID=81824 RepID=A9UWM0_MONBE|nr:uncharacterized protein MONBRDRAFT_24502 [Monosiga brevicollis MX1]EDQ90070.1 predicted protein [Monosiga brevicollis MX1]|eukprot:XP_001744837.1 hypothetical protein [Monosiga brevicollis MX1]